MKLNIDDEQGIEFLHWIFEREFKPPFRKSNKDEFDHTPYYNQDGEKIGFLNSDISFDMSWAIYYSIEDKIFQAFDFPHNTSHWWSAIEPHLKSWMGNQINVKLKNIY